MSSSAGARAVDLLLELVAIPSLTGSESALIDFLERRHRERKAIVESIAVSPGRRNLLIRVGEPRVVLTTHADTVPPHFEPRREGDTLFARGACDAKGSLAAMTVAFEQLCLETPEAGLLVLVGEERGSDGAIAANQDPPQSVQYVVGGEPTANRFVAGSKGCLRLTAEARGVAGHSSLPEAGSSAVPPLLDFLNALRKLRVDPHSRYGDTTMNIGVLQAGTAPNVIAERARAEVLFRTGAPIDELLARVRALAVAGVELEVPYRSEAISFRVPRTAAAGAPVVSFACDLPLLTRWGAPLLLGPGSIADAHSAQEKVQMGEVEQAVSIYADLARELLARGEDFLAPSGEVL